MKLGRIVRPGPDGPVPRLVAVDPDGGYVVDLVTAERLRLRGAGAAADAAARLAAAMFPSSATQAIGGGLAFRDALERAAATEEDEARLRLDDVRLLAPVDPPAMLDASAFEQHLVNAHARGKREVPDYFYEAPAYYKMSTTTILGPDDEVRWPGGVGFMDYELEFAIVIGREGSDLRPEEAADHVFGLTIMNDFSARDVQAKEMTSGFGPAKGKDFGTALGPWITTLDELDLADLPMIARVNGETWSTGSTSTLTWSIDELVAFVSSGERIVPGEVIGSGTVGLGAGLELFRKLQPGDEIELEIGGIGVLRNRIGQPGERRWTPETKERRAQPTLPTREGAGDGSRG
ncbi:MAG TPA: fumarylacetoacetate hydrolase family protein [Actinomycetota bacterium]|nr:fumarylacetoacetate hydrolase family protein [Actinomycetota bacterium]